MCGAQVLGERRDKGRFLGQTYGVVCCIATATFFSTYTKLLYIDYIGSISERFLGGPDLSWVLVLHRKAAAQRTTVGDLNLFEGFVSGWLFQRYGV